jgi:3',5'-cyclic AMP phosphodiesterase CpdA
VGTARTGGTRNKGEGIELKSKLLGTLLAGAMLAGTVATAQSTADLPPLPLLGRSTLDFRLVEAGGGPYRTLTTAPGESYTVREGVDFGDKIGEAQEGREERRHSLTYFGQMTDLHMTDEESPARVEFLDWRGLAFNSAWRAGEALGPFEQEATVRQMNSFVNKAPNLGRGGKRRRMDFVVNTGDLIDNQQYNETLWSRQIMEGSTINPSSGTDNIPGSNPFCPQGLELTDGTDPGRYTGVQDSADWPAGASPGKYFYDPESPETEDPLPGGLYPYEDFPAYPGLMDRAQKPFKATGLKVPSYAMVGNHDGLVQGNTWATGIFNGLATGCLKPVNDAAANGGLDDGPLFGLVVNPALTEADVLSLYAESPELFMAVPPDPRRRLVSRKTFKKIFTSGKDPNGHGFGLVPAAEEKASDGSAGYYSFSPRPGLRFITLETNSDGGLVLVSSSGNLDNPQFEWLEAELKRSERRNEVVVIFGHHAITSLTANVPDENAPPCRSVDPVRVAGCDADPRTSTPIKLRDDVIALLHKNPNTVAWVAGHSHQNEIRAYPNPDSDGGFWQIKTPSIADWPKQSRLLELFDNRDGTLSLFGTAIDHAAPVMAPAPGTPAAEMGTMALASLSRVFSFNDHQGGWRCSPPCGEGSPADRNAELLIADPRRQVPNLSRVGITPKKRSLRAGRRTVLNVKVTNSGPVAATRVRVNVRLSGRGLRAPGRLTIGRIPAYGTGRVKLVVRARRNVRGKAKVTVRTGNRRAASVITIRPAR